MDGGERETTARSLAQMCVAEMLAQCRYICQWFRYFGGLADKIDQSVAAELSLHIRKGVYTMAQMQLSHAEHRLLLEACWAVSRTTPPPALTSCSRRAISIS